jgi:serine/threonine protein kinase
MKPYEPDPNDTVSEDLKTEYSPPPTHVVSGDRADTETAEETRGGQVPADLDYLVLGKYRLIKQLGKGGMGEIYLAEHTQLGKLVAVKIISGDLSHKPQFVGLFKREARSAAKLQHPNIAQVFDYGEEKGRYFYVMDYVQGQSLAEIIDSSAPLPLKKALAIFRQILEGLEHAHKSGILHRDIKPANILLDDSGLVKLLDFGLARSVYEEDSLTAVGQSPGGTPSYTSPEQRKGDPTDARTDIYSAGVTVFEMLTGKVPRDVASPRERLSADLKKTLNPLQKVRASQVTNVVMKCLEDVSERYRTAAEVLMDVKRIERGIQQQRWVIGSAAGAVAAAAVAVVAVLALTPPKLLATDAVRCLEEDKFSRAAKLFAKLSAKDPSDVTSRYGLGLSYIGLGELDRAKAEFEKIARSSGQNTTADEEGLARVAFVGNEADEAVKLCEKAVSTGNAHSLAHVTLGDIYRLRNQLDQAINEYEKALRRKPMFRYQLAEAYAGLGYVLMKKGQYDEAAKAVKGAEDAKPKDDLSAFLKSEIARRTDAERQQRIDALVDDLIKQAKERTAVETPEEKWGWKPTVLAILDLRRSGVALARPGEYEMLMFNLTKSLHQEKRITVVEREVLEELLTELRLGTSDLADRTAELRLGKVLPAGLMVAGALRSENSRFGVDIRLVETETTQLKEMLSQEQEDGETVTEFAERFANRLVEKIRAVRPLKAAIVERDGNAITLDVGAGQGLTPEMEMKIVELPGEREIGKLLVKNVHENSAVAEIIEETGNISTASGAIEILKRETE